MTNEEWIKLMVDSIQDTIDGKLANLPAGYRILAGPPSPGENANTGALQILWEFREVPPDVEPEALGDGWTLHGPRAKGEFESPIGGN